MHGIIVASPSRRWAGERASCRDEAARVFRCVASCRRTSRWQNFRRRRRSGLPRRLLAAPAALATPACEDEPADAAGSVDAAPGAARGASAGAAPEEAPGEHRPSEAGSKPASIEERLAAFVAKFAPQAQEPALGQPGVLPRVGVVATLRDVEDQIQDWVRWYELIGVAHVFLYFDDPEQDATSIAEVQRVYDKSFVSIELNTPELRSEWPSLGCWEQLGEFKEDRMCRQLLNLAHCLRRCWSADQGAPEAVDWLLHLDHDELFLPPPQGLGEHFQHLSRGGCRLCLYQNFEAVPEDHTLQPFQDVSLFKVPLGRVPRTPAGQRSMEFWAGRTQAGNYFLYYDNGKSAVRVRRRANGGKPLAPTSVHLLVDPGEHDELVRTRAAWSNFPQPELDDLGLPWLLSQSDEIVASARVLHYPATHFQRLFRKYHHLKNFPSVRFGGALVVPPSFHLEARNCYLEHAKHGEDVQKLELKKLMERSAFLTSTTDVQVQLRAGTVVRLAAACESVRQGRWLPPRSEAEDWKAWRQRAPSAADMARLQQLPRRDAELLLQRTGGLIGDRPRGLDAVVRQLEKRGWAACALGGRRDILQNALEEARQLEATMTPGVTVVRNQQVDQNATRARRGDKIIWLQEHGLTDSSSGPAPNIVLLAEALENIGMQLDERLQDSSLRLRITERCDGMLACYDGGGAAYGPHIDNIDGDGRVDGRILTAVLYLNPCWQRESGGELSIFEAQGGGGHSGDAIPNWEAGCWHDVLPEAGTLVLFRADRVLHEVRPSLAKRFALSMWFCGQRV